MTRTQTLTPKFAKSIPEPIEVGVLYVSMEYGMAAHKCCCGCGLDVMTPLTPTDWKLTYDGDSITLFPSIGNWSFPCRSHYWIERNAVVWSHEMSSAEVSRGRAFERKSREQYYSRQNPPLPISSESKSSGIWNRLRKFFNATPDRY